VTNGNGNRSFPEVFDDAVVPVVYQDFADLMISLLAQGGFALPIVMSE